MCTIISGLKESQAFFLKKTNVRIRDELIFIIIYLMSTNVGLDTLIRYHWIIISYCYVFLMQNNLRGNSKLILRKTAINFHVLFL